MTLDPTKVFDENLEYRAVLLSEVKAHRRLSRIWVLTGVGLLVGGFVVVGYFPPLGYLMVLAGIIRLLNSFFDFQREDQLRKKLRRLEERFGSIHNLGL